MAKRRFFAGIFGQKLTVSFYFFFLSFLKFLEKRSEAIFPSRNVEHRV